MDVQRRSLADEQRAIDAWAGELGVGYWPVMANLARLCEEVGELSRLLLIREGIKSPVADLGARLNEETGDVLFTALLLCNQLGVDAGDALAAALARARARGASDPVQPARPGKAPRSGSH